jgi:hypothetical protein
MPASGTHYEVLGVAPDATKQQIRKRWATLMQRYHPDHLSGAAPGSNWLDGQARRLIEAYNTLKDTARRRAYDAQLARDIGAQPPIIAERWRDRSIHFGRPNRWKWAPAGIAAIGIVAAFGLSSPRERSARRLSRRRVPPARRLHQGASPSAGAIFAEARREAARRSRQSGRARAAEADWLVPPEGSIPVVQVPPAPPVIRNRLRWRRPLAGSALLRPYQRLSIGRSSRNFRRIGRATALPRPVRPHAQRSWRDRALPCRLRAKGLTAVVALLGTEVETATSRAGRPSSTQAEKNSPPR